MKEEGYRTKEQKGRQTNKDERYETMDAGEDGRKRLGLKNRERKTEEQREEQENAISTDSVKKMRFFH